MLIPYAGLWYHESPHLDEQGLTRQHPVLHTVPGYLHGSVSSCSRSHGFGLFQHAIWDPHSRGASEQCRGVELNTAAHQGGHTGSDLCPMTMATMTWWHVELGGTAWIAHTEGGLACISPWDIGPVGMMMKMWLRELLVYEEERTDSPSDAYLMKQLSTITAWLRPDYRSPWIDLAWEAPGRMPKVTPWLRRSPYYLLLQYSWSDT